MSQDIKTPKFKIAIVAGEKSGDELGAPLIKALKAINPSIKFIGVGGPKMQSQGLDSFFNMDEISVMGIIEPLMNIGRLLKLRKNLKSYLLKEKPDIYIGIDSPDFNLPVEKFLKKELSIKTIQYVSPSVWAWRKGRIKSMEESTDCVLTLFPFEEEAYSESVIDVSYVGHPLAYKINLNTEEINSKLDNSIALLPGSRKSEVSLLGNEMIKAAKKLKNENDKYQFFMPLSNKDHLEFFDNDIEDFINISYGDAHDVLKKTKMAIITSGTATLESILSYTPCVTLYKTNLVSYLIIKPLLSIDFFSLPNLISGKHILPELLQGNISTEAIIESIKYIEQQGTTFFNNECQEISNQLKAGGAEKAASKILELLNC